MVSFVGNATNIFVIIITWPIKISTVHAHKTCPKPLGKGNTIECPKSYRMKYKRDKHTFACMTELEAQSTLS